MHTVLTIAGSDCSGGAGIQADIKTISAHKMYAESVITAMTAQNTTGVFGIQEANPDFVSLQMDCVFQDIPPDAVKIGMVSNPDIIRTIARKLQEYQAKNIVLDPVMVSTSGNRLLSENAEETLQEFLFPLADILTPNLPEAEVLCKFEIRGESEMQAAAAAISLFVRGAVLIKGGHGIADAADLLWDGEKTSWFRAPRIQTENTHGTGCTLSSAIACGLAAGLSLHESVQQAKEYLTGALADGLNLGKGKGPINHLYRIPE